MTEKITTLRTLYVHVVSNSMMFPQILYEIVLYARHFLPAKFFPQYCIAHPYCARILRHERTQISACTYTVNNERNFPQAKLDSEINVRFLLNEHGDLYFLLHNNSAHVILLNLKKNSKKLSEGKKDVAESVHKNRYSRM